MEYKKNDYVTVIIEDIGSDGEGIGKVDGFTLFIKDAVIGDTVEAKIVKSKKHYAYARLEKVIKPSPFRVEPKCAYHRQCGGCQIQALSYEKQLEFKQQKIRNNLIRIGGFAPEYVDERMEPIIGMDKPYHYRNKAQYPVGCDKEGKIITGFYAGRTHNIISNTNCYLGAPENEKILNVILEHMRENQVTAYDETTGKGLVRHILIRTGFTSGEIMVCFVINKKVKNNQHTIAMQDCKNVDDFKVGVSKCDGLKNDALRGESSKDDGLRGEDSKNDGLKGDILKSNNCKEDNSKQNILTENAFNKSILNIRNEFIPKQQELLDKLAQIKGMASVSVSINTEKTNVIMGKEIYTLWGSSTITDTIHVRNMKKEGYPFTGHALTFKISPLSFYQVNPVQTEKLYSLALEYAGLTGNETVWDLYCGIGTISLFLANKAKQVYGVEIIPQAIADAKENAKRNGISNTEFFVGKAEEVLPRFYEQLSHIQKMGEDGQEESNKESGNIEMLHPDVIVVDPPRKGCDEVCLSTILQMQPKRIVYVSCDSATLARDLKVLCDGGYEVKRIGGIDQFGQTVHVETVVLLSKLKSSKSIEVKIELDEMDLTQAESKATYEEIKQYVMQNAGFKVSQLYIAQVKRKHGLIERVNYNVGSGKSKVPQVPIEKEKAIEDALRHFKMI